MKPVSAKRIGIAKAAGLANVEDAAIACRRVGLPFSVACALLEQESGGRNVYGHDSGGVFSRDEHPVVDGTNFIEFLGRVLAGATSNGVGPCQITYAGSVKGGRRDGGYFREMFAADLRPWVPLDNMVTGFGILAGHYARTKSWSAAGTAYNGQEPYGRELAAKIDRWTRRLRA